MGKFKFFIGSSTPEFWMTHRRSLIPITQLTRVHINRILLCLNNRGNMSIPDIYNGFTKQEWTKIMRDELNRRTINNETI
jgi:hypothetical protein